MAHAVLLGPRTMQRGYFQPQVIAKLLDAHSRGEADPAKYLWDLLMLELWQRTFIDGEGLTVPVATDTQTAATTSGSPSCFVRIKRSGCRALWTVSGASVRSEDHIHENQIGGRFFAPSIRDQVYLKDHKII